MTSRGWMKLVALSLILVGMGGCVAQYAGIGWLLFMCGCGLFLYARIAETR